MIVIAKYLNSVGDVILSKNLFFSCLFIANFCINPSFAIDTPSKQAILVDMATNTVLFSKNPDELMTPSSMSKIMTIYKLFEQLKSGGLSLTDTFSVSEKAWKKAGSKMFVGLKSRVKIEDLIRGIIVQSGNDATIVVAEGLSGTESRFAEELNQTAKRLGMTNSHFINASGWPDPGHETTARDLANLAAATIKDFPEYYHYYSETTFTYNRIKQGNRNPVLYRDLGADGLKTGHTEAGGYGLTASAIRNGRRLILVVNGLPSKKIRASEAERLFDWGYREFSNYTLFKKNQVVTNAKVWMGESGTVPLIIDQNLTLTLSRKARKSMKVKVVMKSPVAAPINNGDILAKLRIEFPGRSNLEFDLKSLEKVNKLNAFARLGKALEFLLWGESE